MGIASKSWLPVHMLDDPQALIPLHAAWSFYQGVVDHLGLHNFLNRINTISATQVFLGRSYLTANQEPSSLEYLLKASNPLGIDSNVDSTELKVVDKTWILELTTERHSGGLWIQDLLGIHFLRWSVQYFEPSFFPRSVRVRSGKRLDRQLLLNHFGADHVKYGAPSIGIEIPEELLSRVITPQRVVEIDDSDLIDRSPGTKMPVCFLCSLVETLKTYQDERWLSIKELSELVGFSERTIQRRFLKSIKGASYRDIVLEVKVRSAIELLKDPKLAITQIASRLGFSTPSNFSRSFRNITGISPTDFRRSSYTDGTSKHLTIERCFSS
ncbi:MAG: helix-turn-helix domain-containing protein [Planctomycetota bacterium]|jgi:AraC-like DNA-binding protein